MNSKSLWVAVVVIAIIALYGAFRNIAHAPVIGGVTNYDTISAVTAQFGTGCGDSYTTCNGFRVSAGGAITASSTSASGGNLSTTTGATASTTLVASDLLYSTMHVNPNLVVGATLTLPATSTLTSYLPNVGDTVRFNIVNATTTTVYITLAGGTGTILQSQSSTTRIYPTQSGMLFAVRKSNTDIQFMLVGN